MTHPHRRDYDGTIRSVYAAFLKDASRMELFGISPRARGDAEWDLAAFETRFGQLLDGEDEDADDGILHALARDHASVTISRTWLEQLRRMHGGTNAAVLLYAAMTGGGLGLNDVDGLERGADVDITYIDGRLLVELWVGNRMRIGSDGRLSFETVPVALHMALKGRSLGAIAGDELLRPFDGPVIGCDHGGPLGTTATIAMQDDLIALGDLSPNDVRGIRAVGKS